MPFETKFLLVCDCVNDGKEVRIYVLVLEVDKKNTKRKDRNVGQGRIRHKILALRTTL